MELERPYPDIWEQLEALEYELFPENGLNACSLEREVVSGTRLWVLGNIEAYMLVRPVSGIADILRLGVTKNLQGKGVGTQLLKEAKAAFPSLMLCVRKNNRAALGLYRKFGFQIVGDLGESWTMVTSSRSS